MGDLTQQPFLRRLMRDRHARLTLNNTKMFREQRIEFMLLERHFLGRRSVGGRSHGPLLDQLSDLGFAVGILSEPVLLAPPR